MSLSHDRSSTLHIYIPHHERPIFRSLATNLGTTFKAPTNLGAVNLERLEERRRKLLTRKEETSTRHNKDRI